MEKIEVVDYYDREPNAWDSGLRETPMTIEFEFEPYKGFHLVKGRNFTFGEYVILVKSSYSDETFEFIYEDWWEELAPLQAQFEDSVDDYLDTHPMSQMKLNLQGENHD